MDTTTKEDKLTIAKEAILTLEPTIEQLNKALFFAIKKGNTINVEALLGIGANIEAENDEKLTPLMLACHYGHLEIVKILTQSKADVNKPRADTGSTPLMFAAEEGQTESVKILIQAKANIEAKNLNGWTAIIYAAMNGHLDTVEALIKAGANIQTVSNSGKNALIFTTRYGHVNCINALFKAGANINAVDNTGKNALMIAATDGLLECINALLKAGANINAVDNTGKNALMIAATGGHLECINALLKAGANINAVDNDEESALIGAILTNKVDDYNRVSTVKFLIEAGANIEIINKSKDNALMLAAYHGEAECIKLLVKAGANIETINEDGLNALMLATSKGHVGCVNILVEAGANLEVQVETNKKTALIFAIENNYPATVKALIKRKNGSNLEALDNINSTPLMHAINKQSFIITKMLLKASANSLAMNNQLDTPLSLAIKSKNSAISYLVFSTLKKEYLYNWLLSEENYAYFSIIKEHQTIITLNKKNLEATVTALIPDKKTGTSFIDLPIELQLLILKQTVPNWSVLQLENNLKEILKSDAIQEKIKNYNKQPEPEKEVMPEPILNALSAVKQWYENAKKGAAENKLNSKIINNKVGF